MIFLDARLLLLFSLPASIKTVLLGAVASLCCSVGEQRRKAIVIACAALTGGNKDSNTTNAIVMMMVIGDGGKALFLGWRGRAGPAARVLRTVIRADCVVCGVTIDVLCRHSTGLATRLVPAMFRFRVLVGI